MRKLLISLLAIFATVGAFAQYNYLNSGNNDVQRYAYYYVCAIDDAYII